MSLAIEKTRFTPSDVLDLESEGLYELVDGKLVEKQMSSLASKTAGNITAELYNFLKKSQGGDVFPEQTYQCFPDDRDLVRRPDVSVIVASRLPQVPDEDHIPIAPDLAIEVVSPGDKIYELDEKLDDYRAAGVKLVWVVNPNSRLVHVYGVDGFTALLRETDTLTGEPVLSGFSITVGELLPARKKRTDTQAGDVTGR